MGRLTLAHPRIRRLLRIGLRTMLIGLTVIGLLLGLIVRKSHQQRAVVVWAQQSGGRVCYDYEFASDDRWLPDAEPDSPSWIRKLMDVDFLATVAEVDVRGSEVSDLSPLTRLPDLQAVNILATNISDLSPLSTLTKLRVVWIKDTPVQDLQPLAELTNLERLYLFNTNVSDEESTCFIRYCRIALSSAMRGR